MFNTLQQCIQARNHNNESVLESLTLDTPSCPPGTLPRPLPDTLHLLPNNNPQSDYLEPAPPSSFLQNSRFSGFSGGRLGSVSSGPLSPEVHSPGSPSSINILEVMPLDPLPSAGAHVTNVYQLHEFPLQREHNNNKKIKLGTVSHSYLNTGDINSDLVTLRHNMIAQQMSINDDNISDENLNLNKQSLNKIEAAPISPTLSTTSEAYATLSVSDTNSRLYMNLAPGEVTGTLPAIREETNSNPPTCSFQNPQILNNTVQTPKNCNFNFSDISKIDMDEDKHNYANLGPSEVNYDPRLLTCLKNKVSRCIIIESITPDVLQDINTKINYAVLDLDKSNTENSDNIQGPSSPKTPPIGYTIIDFNKTDALTLVASGAEVDSEGSRKTRHNSTALPPSPTTT